MFRKEILTQGKSKGEKKERGKKRREREEGKQKELLI